MALVRDISVSRDPNELIASFGARAGFVIPADHRVTLSRRDLPNGAVRITRSTRWSEQINPWRQPDRLPIVRSGVLRELMDAARPQVVGDLRVDPADPAYEHFAGMRSALVSPIFHEGDPLYMVIMLRRERDSFTMDDLCTTVLTSNLIGRTSNQLLTAAELRQAHAALDRELLAVGNVQRGLLPQRLPQIPNVSIATLYETSTRSGGDYYDFLSLPNGQWGVIIADVSGHGAGAAVVMAILRTLLRSPLQVTCRHATSPAEILGYLNRGLSESLKNGQFVTAFIGVFDPEQRRLRYANAGHNPPRLLRGGTDEIVPLSGAPGLPLAVLAEHDAPEHEMGLRSGDRLLLYTDGITETFNDRHEMFGIEGLDAALRCCAQTPEGLIRHIRQAVRKHSGAAPADDRTLVALAFH